MATAKSATLTFHIQPRLNEARRTVAEREHRPIANMVEVMSRDYCRRHGVTIPETGALEDVREPIKGSKKKTSWAKKYP